MRTPHVLLSILLVSLLGWEAEAQHFVVANRGAGNVTVHAASDGARLQTVPLPAAAATPEPMYVQQVGEEVLVGDRANDRVVRFSARDYSVLGEIPVGSGVFHMWAGERQLWVNNDIDDTASVIDTRTKQVIATVPMPADLVAQGYKPHDVYVGTRSAWVAMLGGSGASDWVVQFDQEAFQEQRRVAVGGDPHLWWDARFRRLYVLSQETSELVLLRANLLDVVETVTIPGAHGVFQPEGTGTLVVTDITGGGAMDLYTVETYPFGLTVGAPISTGAPTAHNVAAMPGGDRILVTHSGSSSKTVTLYTLQFAGPPLSPLANPQLVKLGEAEADLNPFGLAYVDTD